MEEGCRCAFHGKPWMSRDMDGRLVGATTTLNPAHQQWQEVTRMDEFPKTDERRLGPSGQACPSLSDSYSCLG